MAEKKFEASKSTFATKTRSFMFNSKVVELKYSKEHKACLFTISELVKEYDIDGKDVERFQKFILKSSKVLKG